MKKLTLLGSIGLTLALAAFAGAAQRSHHFDGHRSYSSYHHYGGYDRGFDRSYVHVDVGPDYYAPEYVPAPYAYEPAPYYYDDEPAPYYYDDEPSVGFGFSFGGGYGGHGGHYGGSHFRGGTSHFEGGHSGSGGHRGGGHTRF